MGYSLEIKGKNWEFFAIELFILSEAHLRQKVVHGNPLLGATYRLFFVHVGVLVGDHVPHITEEKAFAARVKGSALIPIEIHLSHSSNVQAYYHS